VLVVYSHPDPASFCAHLRDRAVGVLHAAGHDVDLLDLYAEGFTPELSADERRTHRDPPSTKPQLVEHARRLQRAEALVFVYPTWMGGQPAMLKGWFDRVWINGIAYELPAGASRILPLLRGIRRIAIVTTHGSSKRVNIIEGEPGKRVITRALRVLCHRFARTHWISLYGIDRATETDRAAFVARVERRLARL
jgi:putative NADPH-quinone reductase